MMKRLNKKGLNVVYERLAEDYYDALNERYNVLKEYCDALEEENKRLNKELLFIENVQTKDYERVQTELQQYQKALDKACSTLARNLVCNDCQIECDELREEDLINGKCKWHKKSKEEWKEWCFDDD